MKGIFAVYKPKGITSHDVVNIVRRATGEKRVGHGGTLDPLATGVLVIAVGRENTKKLEKFVKGEKEYIATIKLGEASATDDAEGEKIIQTPQTKSFKPPLQNDIVRCTQKFVGKFPQKPPLFSAKKIQGTPAYKLARKGRTFKMTPKLVEIMQIGLIQYIYPILKIRVKTGPGVYIRALARDIGEELNTGAYLADLERIKVAGFTKEDAITLDRLENSIP